MRLVLAFTVSILLSGCHSITTEPGHETVIVDNPWIFGHGGVRDRDSGAGDGR